MLWCFQASAILGFQPEPSPVKPVDPDDKHETVIKPALGCRRTILFDEHHEQASGDQLVPNADAHDSKEEHVDVVPGNANFVHD